jgi:hypothetical protein
MTLTIKYTDDETMHYMEIYAGDTKLGEVLAHTDGYVTWENYMDHRKEYYLMTVESNGIVNDSIVEI